MAAGSTYTPIATTTLGSAASSYTFSSIPSTYTDLIIVAFIKSTAASLERYVTVQFNSDTATNYSSTTVYGENTTPGSFRTTSQTGARVADAIPATGGTASPTIINFQNYSNATTYKTTISRWNSTTQNGATVSLWRGTPAAINSIQLIISGDQFATGSTFTLYGIAAA